ncbi:hypothetical protein KCP78_21915 [Salmonella enterica subsp. enterica]|nr:hypothetical protein KCP78_21915 [Salmonella enterica subsp. enterica]
MRVMAADSACAAEHKSGVWSLPARWCWILGRSDEDAFAFPDANPTEKYTLPVIILTACYAQ